MNIPQNKAIIGTLGERTLHSELKKMLAPDESTHEIRVGRYVADIFDGTRIIEIQTRAFNKLRGKLSYFINEKNLPVTVVFPVAYTKYLNWVDPLSAEVRSRRKSPKKGKVYDIFPELYKITPLLSLPKLSIQIIFADIEEFRLADGWSSDGKKGSTRIERLPTAFHDELTLTISQPEDYLALVPFDLPEHFTLKDFAAASSLSYNKSSCALNVLCQVGVCEKIGKIGRSNLYSVK